MKKNISKITALKEKIKFNFTDLKFETSVMKAFCQIPDRKLADSTPGDRVGWGGEYRIQHTITTSYTSNRKILSTNNHSAMGCWRCPGSKPNILSKLHFVYKRHNWNQH